MKTGYITLDGRHISDGVKNPLQAHLTKDWIPTANGGYCRKIFNHTEYTKLTRLGLKDWKDDIFYQTSYCEGRKPYTLWEKLVMLVSKKLKSLLKAESKGV